MSRANRQQRDSRKKNVRQYSTPDAQYRNGKLPVKATPILSQERFIDLFGPTIVAIFALGAMTASAYIYQAVMF